MRLSAAARELLPGRIDYDLAACRSPGGYHRRRRGSPVGAGIRHQLGRRSGSQARTAVVVGIVAAVFGGSPVQVSGPTGAVAVVLAPIVAAHGTSSVAVVSILGGGVVLVAGAARLGRLVGYLPWPVVEGFRLGITYIISLQQVPAALGITSNNSAPTAINYRVIAGRSTSRRSAGNNLAPPLPRTRPSPRRHPAFDTHRRERRRVARLFPTSTENATPVRTSCPAVPAHHLVRRLGTPAEICCPLGQARGSAPPFEWSSSERPNRCRRRTSMRVKVPLTAPYAVQACCSFLSTARP